MTLSTTISAGKTILEVFVDYNKRTSTVTRIRSCFIEGPGRWIEISDLLTTHFEPCLNKLIDSVDWREVARKEMTEA